MNRPLHTPLSPCCWCARRSTAGRSSPWTRRPRPDPRGKSGASALFIRIHLEVYAHAPVLTSRGADHIITVQGRGCLCRESPVLHHTLLHSARLPSDFSYLSKANLVECRGKLQQQSAEGQGREPAQHAYRDGVEEYLTDGHGGRGNQRTIVASPAAARGHNLHRLCAVRLEPAGTRESKMLPLLPRAPYPPEGARFRSSPPDSSGLKE